MKAIETLSKISCLKIENLMKHEQFANVMDFLGLRGFKRQAEYHYLKENINFRKLHRFAINHCGELIYDKDVPNPKLIPVSWQGHTRGEVDTSTRKKYVRQLFIDWKNWEEETQKKLSCYFKEIETIDLVVANYILDMIEDVETEIKYLCRQIIEYEAIDWDMIYLMSKQDEMHDCYREKTAKLSI